MDNIIYKSNYSLLGKENTDKTICGNYAFFPKRLIGKGSFSNTYFGYKLINLQEVGIKINRKYEKISTTSIEVEVLKKIKEFRGFPRIKGICKYGNHDAIIQDLLGPSLKKIIEYYGQAFPHQTICKIGIEILKRLKALHQINILHNDLKPSNFCWGLFRNNEIELSDTIFIIDFGLSSQIDNLKEKKICKIV